MQGIHSITGTGRAEPCFLLCMTTLHVYRFSFLILKTCRRQTLNVRNFTGNGKLQNIKLNCKGAVPDYFSYASKYWFVLFLATKQKLKNVKFFNNYSFYFNI